MDTSPKDTHDDFILENSLFFAGKFRLAWRSRFKFDETNPTVLLHLKEYNGLKVGDQVKIDPVAVDRRNFDFHKEKRSSGNEISSICDMYNSYKLRVGGFVKLDGFFRSHKKKKIPIEHIFAMLISCRPGGKDPVNLLSCLNSRDSSKKTEEILLFWTETLKKA